MVADLAQLAQWVAEVHEEVAYVNSAGLNWKFSVVQHLFVLTRKDQLFIYIFLSNCEKYVIV